MRNCVRLWFLGRQARFNWGTRSKTQWIWQRRNNETGEKWEGNEVWQTCMEKKQGMGECLQKVWVCAVQKEKDRGQMETAGKLLHEWETVSADSQQAATAGMFTPVIQKMYQREKLKYWKYSTAQRDDVLISSPFLLCRLQISVRRRSLVAQLQRIT